MTQKRAFRPCSWENGGPIIPFNGPHSQTFLRLPTLARTIVGLDPHCKCIYSSLMLLSTTFGNPKTSEEGATLTRVNAHTCRQPVFLMPFVRLRIHNSKQHSIFVAPSPHGPSSRVPFAQPCPLTRGTWPMSTIAADDAAVAAGDAAGDAEAYPVHRHLLLAPRSRRGRTRRRAFNASRCCAPRAGC